MTEEKRITFPHNISLEERRNLSVSGVTDIGSYDEQSITAETEQGELTIKGQNLHIIRMSVDAGELVVEGTVNALEYSEMRETGGGFFSRLFK
ncbi:MAG: sporulation protein YabP [Clostridia bacterium]|nr:sporulation protein YabP [Clostridia bacterium]